MNKGTNNPDDNGILFRRIELSRHDNKITICLYNHEITHTQLTSRRSCYSLLDTETLPILMEEVFASKIDPFGNTLEKLRNNRLLELARILHSYKTIPNIAYVSRIGADTYIKSTLQAIWLGNIYLTGNSALQKEMQDYISRVFAEERAVEDMLDYYDANEKDVPKCLKKLKVPR